jgi:diaminopimelate epimerase
MLLNLRSIKLRVWERGVGETPACGSGACAAVVIGQQQNLLDANVTVELPGGDLAVEWQGGATAVYLVGPAIWVYDGVINS